MPIFKKVNKDFFKKWTPEMAYVLGFFAADGYITVNKRGGQFWCIQIIDEELLLKIREVIGSNHKIGKKVRFGNENNIYRLQIGSIEMCNDLRNLGYRERKTKSLAIPFVPHEYFLDFVRGFFDGDGNVWTGYVHKERKKKTFVISIEFTSCSKDFLLTLQKSLTKFNVLGGSLICKQGYFKLKYSVNNSKIIYRLMYSNISRESLFLERKREVFEKYLKKVKNAAVAQR